MLEWKLGERVNIKHIYRIWKMLNLQLPKKRPRRKRLGSDNGPEFTANALINWLTENNIGPAFIKPGSPWQNAYVESFNGKFRDECSNREGFYNRRDVQVIIEKWRHHYNHERPDSALNNQPPAKVSGRNYAA